MNTLNPWWLPILTFLLVVIAVEGFIIARELSGEGPKWPPPPPPDPYIQKMYDDMPEWDQTRTLADRINFGLCENAWVGTHVVMSLRELSARQDSIMMMMSKRRP